MSSLSSIQLSSWLFCSAQFTTTRPNQWLERMASRADCAATQPGNSKSDGTDDLDASPSAAGHNDALWGMTNLRGVPRPNGELLHRILTMTRVVTNPTTYPGSRRDRISSPKPQSWSKESPFDFGLGLGQVHLLPTTPPANQKPGVLLLEL